jgi:hypothetical protein
VSDPGLHATQSQGTASAWRGSPHHQYSPITHADSLHQDADYPAIVPSERSKVVLRRELTSEKSRIRGMLVSGPTAEDVSLLDAFEGDARIYLSLLSRCEALVYYFGIEIRPIAGACAPFRTLRSSFGGHVNLRGCRGA